VPNGNQTNTLNTKLVYVTVNKKYTTTIKDELVTKLAKEKEDEYFIEKRALGELFDSSFNLEINLYRGDNPHNNDSIFYPILKSFLLSNGRVRDEDIKTYKNNGELWVKCKTGGISLFDVLGIPVKSWDYYTLTKKTKIPFGLVITKDDYKKRLKATHYTIRPNWDMPVTNFCVLLDKLAIELKKV
jgi:hypothetical protein